MQLKSQLKSNVHLQRQKRQHEMSTYKAADHILQVCCGIRCGGLICEAPLHLE